MCGGGNTSPHKRKEKTMETVDIESRCIYGEVKNTEPVGSSAAIREALELCQRVIHCAIFAGILRGDDAYDALNKSKAALSEPIRNCDVGTAEEQEKRFVALCNKQHDDCFMCPVQNNMKSQCDCKFVWAQMPYEKGE